MSHNKARHPGTRAPAVLITVVTALAFAFAAVTPTASADPTAALAAAVNAQRAAALCPALQADPMVQRVADMASRNTVEYAALHTASVPFTDPVAALSTIGHPVAKALLFSGYGPTEEVARQATVLHYRTSQPDCSYTQFGVSVLRDDDGAYHASVVLATPESP